MREERLSLVVRWPSGGDEVFATREGVYWLLRARLARVGAWMVSRGKIVRFSIRSAE